MSLALVIKNTILVILIILIGHFMVKNILLEKTTPTTAATSAQASTPTTAAQASTPTTAAQAAQASQVASVVETPSGTPSQAVVSQVQGGLDKAKQELLKFIDDEEEDNLDDYFAKDNTTECAPAPLNNFNTKIAESPIPLNTTCDQSVQQLHKLQEVQQPSQNASNASNASNAKNVAIVNEYDNESTMNGGHLFGGLGAFDAFDSKYEAYTL